MHIRVLNPSDVEAFRKLRLQRLEESPTAFGTSSAEEAAKPLQQLAQQLEIVESDGSFVLGAFNADELIGMIGLGRHDRLKYRHKADLWGMYVIPEWRNQGVGQALLDAALARSRTIAGLRQIILTVNAANQAARRLYQSRGFETFGIEKDALYSEGIYFDLEHMQLMLEG